MTILQISSIGYAGMNAANLAEWESFSHRLLACPTEHMRGEDGTKILAVRADEKSHRLLLRESDEKGGYFFGLEVRDAAALEQARAELADAGISITRATDGELATRRVDGMFHFQDPAGYRLEIYHGLANADRAFTPPRAMGGFRTGELGFGHAVITVPNLEKSRDFYCDLLNFRVSDYVLVPNRRVFLHTNGRHHSIAFAERAGLGIAHLMFEVNEFDDLGRAYDIALSDYPDAIFSTLGRHSNDLMTSFYIKSPNGVPIEYGWGGLIVDDSSWQVAELFGPSIWGHDRIAYPPEARLAADRQREYALAHGIRAPLQVTPANSTTTPE